MAHPHPSHALRIAPAILALAAILNACAEFQKEKLPAPHVTVAPYSAVDGEPLWAVVPLRNESGTSIVDTLAVTDAVVAASEQVRGVRCVPLNRTIEAMRALQMPEPRTPGDLQKLAQAMGVDALLVGSITAYDPYDPPTLGLAVALYPRPGALESRSGELNPHELTARPTDYRYFTRSNFDDAPASVVSELMDANGNDVLMRVKEYAQGRDTANSPIGWRRYTASVDLYTEFAAWHTVSRLMDQEWLRLARTPPAPPPE